MEIESRIRAFIARNILFSGDAFPYQNDASFLRNGIIDSLGVVELVTFAGREFGIQIEPAEVTPENFDSVNYLASFIRRKLGHTEESCVSA
jgi:acyl carrier protein